MNLKQSESILNKNATRKYQMARFICLLLWIQGLIMAIITYKEKHFTISTISISYSTLMLIVLIYTTITKKLRLFFVSSIILVLYLELNFMIHGGTEGFGIIWISLIPLFTIYLFELRGFYVVNSIVFAILVAGFWTPLNRFLYSFRPSFLSRFPIVYQVAFIFSAFLKFRITKTEEELKQQKDLLSREIEQASIIQKAFLSHPHLVFPHWSLAYKNIPMAGVSGDLYDIYSEKGDLKGIGIYDISGHGVSSGMLTMLIKNIIQSKFSENTERPLSQTVELINEKFIQDKGGVSNYLTGILVKINGNKIELVNAGHQYPIFYKKSSDTFTIIHKDPAAMGAIGLKGFPCVYVSQFLEMESGDELILFSDGLVEAKNSEEVLFGTERLKESFAKIIHGTVKEQIKSVITDIHDYIGAAPATDDMTIIILKKD